MAVRGGRPQLDCSDMPQTCKLLNPALPGWSEVIDESLRRPQQGGALGPVSRLAFDAAPFLDEIGGRLVFSPRPDVLMAHLSHPMLQHAISTLSRRRFPGTGEEVSRWTVRQAPLPVGTDAWILLSVEELAVNDLRETFHHWVRTLVLPVINGELRPALPHCSARDLRGGQVTLDRGQLDAGRALVEDVEPELKALLGQHADQLTKSLHLTPHLLKRNVSILL